MAMLMPINCRLADLFVDLGVFCCADAELDEGLSCTELEDGFNWVDDFDWPELGVVLEVVGDFGWLELADCFGGADIGIGEGLGRGNIELEEVRGLGTAELDMPAIASRRSSFT